MWRPSGNQSPTLWQWAKFILKIHSTELFDITLLHDIFSVCASDLWEVVWEVGRRLTQDSLALCCTVMVVSSCSRVQWLCFPFPCRSLWTCRGGRPGSWSRRTCDTRASQILIMWALSLSIRVRAVVNQCYSSHEGILVCRTGVSSFLFNSGLVPRPPWWTPYQCWWVGFVP